MFENLHLWLKLLMTLRNTQLYSFFPCIDPPPATGTFCVGAENEPDGGPEDWQRIAELQSRNKACLPHLKSSYPVEFEVRREGNLTGSEKLWGSLNTRLQFYTFILMKSLCSQRPEGALPSSVQTKSSATGTPLTQSDGDPCFQASCRTPSPLIVSLSCWVRQGSGLVLIATPWCQASCQLTEPAHLSRKVLRPNPHPHCLYISCHRRLVCSKSNCNFFTF